MRTTFSVIVALSLLGAPALADPKVDEAVRKANEQFKKGKPDEAVKTLQKLPPSVEGLVALGRLQERLGSPESLDDAAASYAKAAALQSPARGEAIAAQAGLELRVGTAAHAVKLAQEAVQIQETASTLGTLARALARVDPAKALEVGNRAVAEGATSPYAHSGLAAAFLFSGRYDEAAAAYRKAIELAPTLSQPQAALAEALMAQGKAAEAVAAARKAVEMDPGFAEAHSTLALAILADNPKAWSDAIAEAQDAAFKNPKSASIQIAVAKIFEADGRFDQASQAYKKALDSDPGFAAARTALIEAQFRRGDLDGALAEARKLAVESPGSGDAQLKYGELLLRKNDYAEAVAPLEKAARLLHNSAEAHYYYGRALQFTGKLKEAVAPYKRAAELQPANEDYRITYGLILGVDGQYDAGAAELLKVVNKPGYKGTAAWTNLGWIYRNAKRNDEAIRAYKKALDFDPKNAQAALGLGWTYSYQRLWNESIAAFKKAMEMDKSLTGDCLNGMAWALFFKREFKDSRATLEKAQAAGRGDARLDSSLDRIEKLLAEGKAATEESMAEAEKEREEAQRLQQKLEALNDAVRSNSAATRAKAALEIARIAGGDAVPTELWLLTDKDYGVRTAACQALGNIGPAARSAVKHINAIVNQPIVENPFADKAELEALMKEHDLRRCLREALSKIQR